MKKLQVKSTIALKIDCDGKPMYEILKKHLTEIKKPIKLISMEKTKLIIAYEETQQKSEIGITKET